MVDIINYDPVIDARILLIEESRDQQIEIMKKLRDCGIHNVTVSESFDQVLNEIKDNIGIYNMVILGYSLPDISRLGIIRKIKEVNSQISVIVVSSCGSERFAIEAFRSGIDHYLTRDEVFSGEMMQEIIPQELIRLFTIKQADLRGHLEDNSCELSVLVFKFGVLGPEPYLISCLPFEDELEENQKEEFLIKLGAQYMSATGAGQEYALGLFEFPVFGHKNYHALVYSFWMKEENHPDSRIRQNEKNYGLVVILYPKIFRAVLPTRFDIEKKIDQVISQYRLMDDLDDTFIKKIRRIFLD